MTLTDEQRDVAISSMELLGTSLKVTDLGAALASAPQLERTIDGASTLQMTVSDYHRKLLRSDMLELRTRGGKPRYEVWVTVDGRDYELTQATKNGDRIDLTFDDAVVVALRQHDGVLKKPAGSTTRSAFVAELAREARVDAAVDPSPKRGKIQQALVREKGTNSWDALDPIASDVQWRRFSDGLQLVVGSDAWLTSRQPPVELVEHVGGVDNIDFDAATVKAEQTATVTVSARRWALPPGQGAVLPNLGPASGLWLVKSMSRSLVSVRASVGLVRAQTALAEPVETDGDSGRDGAAPVTGGTDRGGKAYSGGADRAIAYGKTLTGKPYVYGGGHPNPKNGGYDCSGFVSVSVHAGGSKLNGTAKTLLAQCKTAGSVISVADALKTRGALLFDIGGGAGASRNHVAMSLGNDSTLEARSTKSGIGVFDYASKQGWTHGALVPGF